MHVGSWQHLINCFQTVRSYTWSCDIDCIIWSSNGPPQNLSPWASWTWLRWMGRSWVKLIPKKNRRWPEMSWWSHMSEQGVQKICVSLKMPGWYKLTSMFFCEPGMISSRLRGFLRFQPWWGLGLSPAWKWSTHQAHILSFLLGFHLFAGHKAAKGSRNRRLVLDQGNLRTSL